MRELAAAEGLTRFGVVGYSLGGNLTLKLAGEAGADPALAPWLRGVCAVSPTMDLARCVDALERRANAVYQWNFMRNLKSRMRRKAAAWPGRYDTAPLGEPAHGARLRRRLHRAAPRLRRRLRLLPSRQRAARRRADPRAGADRRLGQRSVRAARAVRRAGGGGQPAHPRADHARRRPLRLPQRARPGLRRLLGRAHRGRVPGRASSSAPPRLAGRRRGRRLPEDLRERLRRTPGPSPRPRA